MTATAHEITHDDVTVPDASRAERQTSTNPDDFSVPTGREENWRFTPLSSLRGLHENVELSGPALHTTAEVAGGASVTTSAMTDPAIGSSGMVPTDRVSARAWVAASEATMVRIPRNENIDDALMLTRSGTSAEPTAAHTVLVAEQSSSATVIMRSQGSVTLAENVEVVVDDNASLTVISVQRWDDDAVHLGSLHAKVGRDATFKHIVVTLGGGVVRLESTATYAAPGGSYEGLGVYFADAGQHLEHRLFADHSVPHCRSNVVYKGALQGETARAVWIGDVLIRAAAEGTETYELNRNLLLTEGARADSVPNLEIETGQIVNAGHASATGRFDDEQLFYLMARGIDRDEARRLVVLGFFVDVIEHIGVDSLVDELTAAVEAELAQTA